MNFSLLLVLLPFAASLQCPTVGTCGENNVRSKRIKFKNKSKFVRTGNIMMTKITDTYGNTMLEPCSQKCDMDWGCKIFQHFYVNRTCTLSSDYTYIDKDLVTNAFKQSIYLKVKGNFNGKAPKEKFSCISKDNFEDYLKNDVAQHLNATSSTEPAVSSSSTSHLTDGTTTMTESFSPSSENASDTVTHSLPSSASTSTEEPVESTGTTTSAAESSFEPDTTSSTHLSTSTASSTSSTPSSTTTAPVDPATKQTSTTTIPSSTAAVPSSTTSTPGATTTPISTTIFKSSTNTIPSSTTSSTTSALPTTNLSITSHSSSTTASDSTTTIPSSTTKTTQSTTDTFIAPTSSADYEASLPTTGLTVEEKESTVFSSKISTALLSTTQTPVDPTSRSSPHPDVSISSEATPTMSGSTTNAGPSEFTSPRATRKNDSESKEVSEEPIATSDYEELSSIHDHHSAVENSTPSTEAKVVAEESTVSHANTPSLTDLPESTTVNDVPTTRATSPATTSSLETTSQLPSTTVPDAVEPEKVDLSEINGLHVIKSASHGTYLKNKNQWSYTLEDAFGKVEFASGPPNDRQKWFLNEANGKIVISTKTSPTSYLRSDVVGSVMLTAKAPGWSEHWKASKNEDKTWSLQEGHNGWMSSSVDGSVRTGKSRDESTKFWII